MLDPEDLRAFVEAVEAGGFNRAAARLGVAKSIVSRRIARLEAELGVRLLTRTTRGISPTEAGLDLKVRGERVLAELEEMRDAVAQQSSEVSGRLRVSAPLSFVNYLAPIFSEMGCRHPKLELDVSFSDRHVDLVGERFDAAIRAGTVRDPSLIVRRLAPVLAVVVASPGYLARKGVPQTPDDLAQHDFLIYSGGPRDLQFHKGNSVYAVRPAGRLASDNGDALINWAVAGLGVLITPTFLAQAPLESGELVPVLADYALPELGIYVVRPPGAYVPGKVRVLTDTLVRHFEATPVPDSCIAHRK